MRAAQQFQWIWVYRRVNETLNALSEGPGRQIKPLTEILEDSWNFLGMSWEGTGNTHYTKLRSPQDPDAMQPQIPFNKNNRSIRPIREKIIEQAQRYQPPFNKGSPVWNICSMWNICETLLGVTPLLSVKLFLVWHLSSVWSFYWVWHLYSLWSFCSMWRFRLIIDHQSVSEALGSW